MGYINLKESLSVNSKLQAIQDTGLFDTSVLKDFVVYLDEADERDLFRMSPIRYAHRQGISEHDALDLFLYATHVGLLDFEWAVLCPSCGAFLSTNSGLRWLESGKSCSLCMIPQIEPTLDDNVEVAFTVHPAVRSIRFHDASQLDFERDGLFQIFSPSVALFPEVHHLIHGAVFAGEQIPADTSHLVTLNFEQSHYMVLIPATHSGAQIYIDAQCETSDVEFELLIDGQVVPNEVRLAPGEGKLTFHNRTHQAVVAGFLKDPRIAPTPFHQRPDPIPSLYKLTPFLTGKQLLSSQTFRELFHAQSIPTTGLRLKNLTLLFTDLKDSTAMYGRIGDLPAFDLVRTHFALLRGIIAQNGGAIVKTMGDAVMANFVSPDQAFNAALVMHQQIGQAGQGLELKIGIHSGPCIAVEQNGQLDYFGQTANIASRVQSIAMPGEIVMSQSAYEPGAVAAILRTHDLAAVEEYHPLKGVDSRFHLYRITIKRRQDAEPESTVPEADAGAA